MPAQPDQMTRDLVLALHETSAQGAFVVTGAGSRFISWLLGEPGSSATVLDAQIPYAEHALNEYVGRPAEQHVSEAEAIAMAEEAYWRALRLDALAHPGSIGERQIIGVACTATIATNRLKRGEHRTHMAVRSSAGTSTSAAWLEKGVRDRSDEEEIVSRALLNATAKTAGLEVELDLGLGVNDRYEPPHDVADNPLMKVINGDASYLLIAGEGSVTTEIAGSIAAVAGSFNPIHEGHRDLVQVAARITGKTAVFEISVTNVDKPQLSASQLDARIAQVRRQSPILITRAPTFEEKARLVPGTTFVIGYDTATRVVDDYYYAGTVEASLDVIRESDCNFLTAGRLDDGIFRSIDDLKIPPGYESLFTAIPENMFRFDGSSTELRAGRST
ncbi:MAG: hypothetical protein HQ478_07685 [Chloroflexi bacterium]|nr:hypothetical protein [Chloroflexota bacterium]